MVKKSSQITIAFYLRDLNFIILYSDFETYNEGYGIDATETYRFKITPSFTLITC
jgi:hypothetical protein